MAEEGHHRHRHHHHHHNQETPTGEIDYRKEEKHHKHLEHLGELGAVSAGAFAPIKVSSHPIGERPILRWFINISKGGTDSPREHKAKKDPENAHGHKIEEEIAATVAVGAGGYAFHEHHMKKEAKKEDEEAHGKKHHHLFH